MASWDVDLLELADLTAGEMLEVQSWQEHPLKSFHLAPGWWRAVADVECAPLFLDLWGVDSGDAINLVIGAPTGAPFRTRGGRIEARLGLGAQAGRFIINSLGLRRVRPLERLMDFSSRGLGIALSGDLRRLSGALGTLLASGQPITLRPVSKTDEVVRPLSTGLRAGVVIEGGDPTVTLASLKEQVGAMWSLATHLESPVDFWITLKAGDRLSPNAIAQIGARFSNPGIDVVYTDEFCGPARTAKPQWDAEFARHGDYVGRLVAWRASTTAFPVPQSEALNAIFDLAARRGDSAVNRLALPLLERPEGLSVSALSKAPPLVRSDAPVTVIVPTRDRPELIGPCLKAILDQTQHQNLELMIVDNGTRDEDALALIDARRGDSRVRVIRIDAPFNYSALNNEAVRDAQGETIALLNNDVMPRDSDWLSHLVARAQEPGVGAVGPLLLYPDETVQHGGVALGIGGVAGHPWKGIAESEVSREPRLAFPQQRSALTAACLVMRRSVFDAVGGFDEVRFPVTLNDVDLCLRIRQAGLRLIMDPRIRLVHHESKSRRSDRAESERARVISEQNHFRSLWGLDLADDPFYSPALTKADETGRSRMG